MKKTTNLQSQILDDLSKEMQASIDFEVMAGVLCDSGWHRIRINYAPPTRSWNVIKDWTDKNCKESHLEHSGTWLFESAKDANWFVLRWGGND